MLSVEMVTSSCAGILGRLASSGYWFSDRPVAMSSISTLRNPFGNRNRSSRAKGWS